MAVTFDQLQEAIFLFSKRMNSDQLGLICHEPAVNSITSNCILNTLNVVKAKGGEVRYGWFFLHRKSKFGDYLIATHHSVWLDNNVNKLIDVTPYNNDKLHVPITQDNELLFLLDDNANPMQSGIKLIPLPSHFIPIIESLELIRHTSKLQMEERIFYKNEYGMGF